MNNSDWISVEDRLPEYGEKVLASFYNVHDELIQCVAHLESVSQHAFKDSPYHDHWYVFPGWGHKIKPTHWHLLPELPK